jgi:hypothetical protein
MAATGRERRKNNKIVCLAGLVGCINGERMAERITIKNVPGVGDIEGVTLKFRTLSEGDTAVELEDGTKVIFKPVMLEVIKQDEYDASGSPVYLFKISEVIVSVDVPEGLKKKTE